MSMFFSKSTGGFYSSEIHGADIPADAVSVADSEYAELISGQCAGKVIVADKNGRPVLSDLPALTAEQVAELVTKRRAAAYRNESDPLFFKAQRGEATMEEWNAKVAEIKARYPEGVIPS